MNLANQYKIAAIGEEQQAQYYFAIAEGLRTEDSALNQEEYEKLIQLGNVRRENAIKYRDAAEQYRLLASQQ